MKPDWLNGHSIMGGKWEDVPRPYVFFFPRPDGVKRRVKCDVHVYSGIGTHFYASVYEQMNYVWNGETWAQPWNQTPGQSLVLEGKDITSPPFDTATEAKNFINRALKEHFSPDTHTIDPGEVGQVKDFQWDWAEDFDPNGDW